MFTYKKLIVLILVIFLGVPSVSLGGSFVVSLIQGKTPSEAVQIIAEQMDSIIGRVQTLETKQVETSQNIKQTNLEIERLKLENQNLKLRNDNLEKESALTSSKQSEQICQTLFADVPKIYFPVYGENYDIKANIVRYYELNKFIVDNRIDDKWSLEKRMSVIQVALPLYQKFKEQCPNFKTDELPTKTGWCVYAEKYSKM